MALCSKRFSNNSAKNFTMQLILDLVGDISYSGHQHDYFFQADSYCLIEDVLLLFVMRLEALSGISSASKFCLRLSRPLVAVNSALRVDSTFLQDLSIDLLVLVEAVGFLQTFLEALKTMVGLAML